MRSAAFCIAAAASLVPSVGAAQVLGDLDAIVSTAVGGTAATGIFLGIAENTGFVDASVTISASGAVAGSQTAQTTGITSVSTENTPFGGLSAAVAGIATGTGGPNCDVNATGDVTSDSCDFTLGNAEVADFSSAVAMSSTAATTNTTFGTITTLAAGAVNDVSLDLTLNSGSGSNGAGGGASAVGMTLAVNEANADGSVTVVMNTTDGGTAGVNTTAVGSVNNGNATVRMGNGSLP